MEIQYLENVDIYRTVILNGMFNAEKSVWVATANVKDLQIEEGRLYVSILKQIRDLCKKGVEFRILHSGVPSEAFLKDFKKFKLYNEKNFMMKRCLRVHFKSILIDARKLFIGSPNLTGAGLGAKAEKRRNFEIGILTDKSELIERVHSLFSGIWEGEMCTDCGRRKYCYVPLEQPV